MPRYDGKRKKQKQGPRLKKGLHGPASSQAAAASTGTDAFIGFDAFGTSFGSSFSAAGGSTANTLGGPKGSNGNNSNNNHSGKKSQPRNSAQGAAGAGRMGVKLPEFYNGDDRDVDFQLKKLAKRDDTTRRKALETLIDTMQQAPRPLLRASLRHVLYEYNRLVLSNDHRIRRLAHELLGCYSGLQQALAKLRSDVVVSLWLGTADPHRAVAAKAERTLRAIVRPSNVAAVVETAAAATADSTGGAAAAQSLASSLSVSDATNITCSIADLLSTNARGAADRKNLSEEESDKRVARVLRQCLTGLVLLFSAQRRDSAATSAAAATTTTTTTTDEEDLDENSFKALMAALRFFKNNDEVLRRSAYRAVGAGFRLMSPVQQGSHVNTIAKAAFGCFTDKAAMNYNVIWDLVLDLLPILAGSRSLTHSAAAAAAAAAPPIKKWLLPQFWRFLGAGCYGAQDISFTALVPFAAGLPPNITLDAVPAASDTFLATDVFVFKLVRSLFEGFGMSFVETTEAAAAGSSSGVVTIMDEVVNSSIAIDAMLCAVNCLTVVARRQRQAHQAAGAGGGTIPVFSLGNQTPPAADGACVCFRQSVQAVVSGLLQLDHSLVNRSVRGQRALESLHGALKVLLSEAAVGTDDTLERVSVANTLVIDSLRGCMQAASPGGHAAVDAVPPRLLKRFLSQATNLLRACVGDSDSDVPGPPQSSAVFLTMLRWLIGHSRAVLMDQVAIVAATAGAGEQRADAGLERAVDGMEVLVHAMVELLPLLPENSGSEADNQDQQQGPTVSFSWTLRDFVFQLHRLLPTSAADDLRSATMLKRMSTLLAHVLRVWCEASQSSWGAMPIESGPNASSAVGDDDVTTSSLTSSSASFASNAISAMLCGVMSTAENQVSTDEILQELSQLPSPSSSFASTFRRRPAAVNACCHFLAQLAHLVGTDSLRDVICLDQGYSSLVTELAVAFSLAAAADGDHGAMFLRSDPNSFADLLHVFSSSSLSVEQPGDAAAAAVDIRSRLESTLQMCVGRLESFASSVATLSFAAAPPLDQTSTSQPVSAHLADMAIQSLRYFGAYFPYGVRTGTSSDESSTESSILARGSSAVALMVSHVTPPGQLLRWRRGAKSSRQTICSAGNDDDPLYGTLFARQLVVRCAAPDVDVEKVLQTVDNVLVEAQIELAEFWTDRAFCVPAMHGITTYVNAVLLSSSAEKNNPRPRPSSWFLASAIVTVLDAYSSDTLCSDSILDLGLVLFQQAFWDTFASQRRDSPSFLYACEVLNFVIQTRSLDLLSQLLANEGRSGTQTVHEAVFLRLLWELKLAEGIAQQKVHAATTAGLGHIFAAGTGTDEACTSAATAAESWTTIANFSAVALGAYVDSLLLENGGGTNESPASKDVQHAGFTVFQIAQAFGQFSAKEFPESSSLPGASSSTVLRWLVESPTTTASSTTTTLDPLMWLLQRVLPVRATPPRRFVSVFYGLQQGDDDGDDTLMIEANSPSGRSTAAGTPRRKIADGGSSPDVNNGSVDALDSAASSAAQATGTDTSSSAEDSAPSSALKPSDVYDSLPEEEKLRLALVLSQMSNNGDDESGDDDSDEEEEEEEPEIAEAELPYGGDLMKAMRAQDRAAIRTLMAHRDQKQRQKTARAHRKKTPKKKKPLPPGPRLALSSRGDSAAAADNDDDAPFRKQDMVLYLGRDGKLKIVEIVSAHVLAGEPPYYSITWADQGEARIRQTVATRLSRIPADLVPRAQQASSCSGRSPSTQGDARSTANLPTARGLLVAGATDVADSGLGLVSVSPWAASDESPGLIALAHDLLATVPLLKKTNDVAVAVVVARHAIPYIVNDNTSGHPSASTSNALRDFSAKVAHAEAASIEEGLRSSTSNTPSVILALELSTLATLLHAAFGTSGWDSTKHALTRHVLSVLPVALETEDAQSRAAVAVAAAGLLGSILRLWQVLFSQGGHGLESDDAMSPDNVAAKRAVEAAVGATVKALKSCLPTTAARATGLSDSDDGGEDGSCQTLADTSSCCPHEVPVSLTLLAQEHRRYLQGRCGQSPSSTAASSSSSLSADGWNARAIDAVLSQTPAPAFSATAQSAPASPLIQNVDLTTLFRWTCVASTPVVNPIMLDHLFLALFSPCSAAAERAACVYSDAVCTEGSSLSMAGTAGGGEASPDLEDDDVETMDSASVRVRELTVVRHLMLLLGSAHRGLIPAPAVSFSSSVASAVAGEGGNALANADDSAYHAHQATNGAGDSAKPSTSFSGAAAGPLALFRRSLCVQRGFVVVYLALLRALRHFGQLSDRQALCNLPEIHRLVSAVLDFCFRVVLAGSGRKSKQKSRQEQDSSRQHAFSNAARSAVSSMDRSGCAGSVDGEPFAPLLCRGVPALLGDASTSDDVGRVMQSAAAAEDADNNGTASGGGAASRKHRHRIKFRRRDVEAVLVPLAAACLLGTAEEFPLLLRQWFERQQNRATRSAVREFVAQHVTPELVKAELRKVITTSPPEHHHHHAAQAPRSDSGDDAEDKNAPSTMTIRGSIGSRSVTARYSSPANECTFEMRLQLPKDYPLSHVEVHVTQRSGIPEATWKRWGALQMRRFMSTQNGAMADAFTLLQHNLDRNLEGVEPCPICYNSVHAVTQKLPRNTCRTCHNKFHAACLYKWFTSSQNSMCPMCRQPFS